MLSNGGPCRRLRGLAEDTSEAALHMIADILLHIIPEEMLASQRKCAGLTLMTSAIMNTRQSICFQGLRYNKLKPLLLGSRGPL